ncbi:MAG: PilZ domain-containing protein [Planctomycetes bacterium]|nr:PilZ domain-containing protein [Planctomycetota bacterium]
MSAEERRKTPRVRLAQFAEFIQEDRDAKAPNKLVGHAVDLSEGGVRFEAHVGFGVGSKVVINFGLDGRVIAARGKVVHFMPKSDGTASIGIKFTALHQNDREMIQDYCRNHADRQPKSAKLMHDPRRGDAGRSAG